MYSLIQNVHKTQEYFLWALSKNIFEENGVTAFAPGIIDPNLNFACQTGDLKGNIETIIHAVERFYNAQHLPWAWVMNPSRDQTDLKTALEKQGYISTGNHPVLLGSLQDLYSEDVLKKYRIQEVSEGQLSDWIIPLQEAFQNNKANADLYLQTHLEALRKKANLRHFVAYVEGEPVAAATLSLSSNGARLDDLGVKPAYQRKGFGRAMALYRMKIAKELGYEWICLEASDQGALLYKSMGFKELYRNEIYEKKDLK